jgi:tripartite-type tricarboxylate transporter receptor subunit TctC
LEEIAMNLSRRCFLQLAAGAAAFPAISRIAGAQDWPSGAIKIVVPYAPGGSADVIARLAQPSLQRRLGATIIIENRTGGSGTIGAAVVAKSPPDGNTWLLDFDNHAANPFTIPNLPYDTEKDFDPVQLIGTAPYVLSTPASRPFRSLADVISAAKDKPNTITYGTVGAGSIGHLAMVMLSKRAEIALVHVPYRGAAPALNDLVAGHVDFVIASTAVTLPQLQSGAIRPVVQTGAARVPALPRVPTVIESGFSGFEAYAWWGLFAPARTPPAIIRRFSAEFAAALKDEHVAKQLVDTQQVALALNGPEELRKFLAEQMNVWGTVVRENNIKTEN